MPMREEEAAAAAARVLLCIGSYVGPMGHVNWAHEESSLMF